MSETKKPSEYNPLKGPAAKGPVPQPAAPPAPALNSAAVGGPPTAALPVTEERVRQALVGVVDPETFQSIVELGLVYKIAVDNGKVHVQMTLTSPACPVGPEILASAHRTVTEIPGVSEVNVELTWDPPWDPRTMASDEIRLELGLL